MKKYLFMLLLGVVCPLSQLCAGNCGGCSSSNCYPGSPLRNPNNVPVAFNVKRAAANVAFFNFEESPRTTPIIAQPRGVSMTPISIVQSDPTMIDIGLETVLPIELSSFNGKYTEGGNFLTWITASEDNNAGFEIQRSADGKTFENVGFVKGIGRATTQTTYNFTDAAAGGRDAVNRVSTAGATYYRLRQLDFNGKAALSNIVAIQPNAKTSTGLKVYPNPSKDSQISLEFGENTEEVIVTNMLGQTVFQQTTKEQSVLQLNINDWTNGVYFIKSGKETVKFVKN